MHGGQAAGLRLVPVRTGLGCSRRPGPRWLVKRTGEAFIISAVLYAHSIIAETFGESGFFGSINSNSSGLPSKMTDTVRPFLTALRPTNNLPALMLIL